VSWYSGRRAKLHDRLRRKNIEDEFGWWMLALQPISVWRVLLSTHGAAWAEFVPAPSYAQPCRRSMPFDLEATITIALSTGEALTFDHIVRRVTESLRTDIRLSLSFLPKGRSDVVLADGIIRGVTRQPSRRLFKTTTYSRRDNPAPDRLMPDRS
jgi:hypothetical protein